jgi:hypothetical protein
MNAESDSIKVTIAALVKMIQLLGAEMLVGKHREDIDVFESCVRAKLFAHVDGVSPEATAAGVALAHGLVEPVLANLRERVRAMQVAEAATLAAATPPSPTHLLN